MSITFEKRNHALYPAYMNVDGYAIYLEAEQIQSLKEITHLGKNGKFLSLIIDQIGSNAYLQKMIKKSFAKESNPAALALKLRNAINNL